VTEAGKRRLPSDAEHWPIGIHLWIVFANLCPLHLEQRFLGFNKAQPPQVVILLTILILATEQVDTPFVLPHILEDADGS